MNNDRKALELVDTMNRAGRDPRAVTPLAHVKFNGVIKELLSRGLVRFNEKKRTGYEITRAGKAILA